MLISIDQTEGFNPDDYAAEEEKPQEDLVPVSFAPMKMREDLSLGEEFGRGFDRGLLQTKGLGLGLVGALGEAAGLDDVEEYGYTGAQEAMQAASAPELAGEVMSIFDVGSPGDFMHYAAGIMGSQVPNLAISAVTGGVGGMIGKRAVSAAITEALEAKTKQLMGEGVAKEVAKRQAQVALSREMGVNMVEKLAAEKAAQIAATKAGIGVGAAASGVGMEVGSIYSETRDLGLAVKYGVPAGLVEGITTRYFGGKIVDAIEGTGGKKGLMAAGREIGKGIGIESAQEGVQTALELQALEESGVEPGFELFSKEGAKRVTEGAAAGAVMGGGMATGVQGLKLGLTPLTQRALQDVETGLPPGTETQGTEQQDTTDEEKFYNFSPDAVTIDDGDDDPIVARRFTIGTEKGWAIDNPTEEMKRRLVPLGNTGKVALVDGGKDWGSALKLILHNGGRVRNIDPSILDNKVADDDGEYVGLSSFTQENKLGAGTGQQQGKVQGTDLEIDAEQRAFEDQLISKYSQLNNVLNATELLESTGVMPQGSFTGSEREALGGGLNQDERAAILAAVPLRELTKSKAQVERLIRETEEAAAKEGTTPELERQLNFLADVQGRIADFENLKTMQQTLGRKPLEGTAPGDLSAGVSKTDANAEKLAEWSRIVDGRAMALSDLFDTRAKLPKFENQDFEALDAYEMMLADIKKISDEMDLIREAAASAGGSIDPKMLAAKAEQLRQAEMAARELIDDGGPNDVFARSVREKLKKEETKNSKAFDRWFNLNATAENLQDERNELVTQEDIENFDKSYKGKRLERISKVLDDAYDRVVPASVRSAIYEEAAQQARVARGDNEPAAAQRPAIEKELAQLDSKVEGINTRVVYKTPEGNTVVGTLVPDPETGKALDKNGNLVFAPNAFKVGKDSLGNDLTDLADTRPQYERFIRIPKEYAGNIVEDKAAAANARAAREAEKLGVENAKQNTLVQNATAAAAKLNEQSEARDKELDASLEPVFSKDPQGKWQSGVKRGDVVGLKLDDQGKVHRTEFLSDNTRLVPTNAGIYRGMENGEVVFDRYYIAKPKGGKAPKAPNSLALPQLRPGETFVTLSDLDPAEIERLAIPTSERVPQDLWDNLYKAPKTAIFGTAQVPKGGMVQRPARRGTRMKQTPTIVEDETGDLEVQDVFTFEGDLTNPEEILTVALGKINMTPTREELMSAGFTPTGETQEFQVGRNYRESEVYDTTIKDPLSKSGLDIPVKAGLFKDSKNPDAPALVKLYAEFDPSDVYEAMEELEAKRTAPDTAQKNANIVRAEQSLAKAVQDLRRLTLAQMNMGLDVRVREINGIPEAQFLSDFGFVAERSGGKKGAIGNHIVTEVSYNPNPDFKGGGDTFRRKVQNPRLTQQKAAETLTNMTQRGRGFDAKKSGLGVANNVLGNFRRQTLEIAQEAKEKQQAAIERGSDLASRHAESLVRLTAFTRPMFERYAVAIRKHIEEAQGSTPEFKDRWLLEAELRLARELNKTQLRAMPASVVAEMQKQIKTKERSAEKVKPVEGKRRVLKKGKNYGDLVDDPKMRGRRFQRAMRTWKQKLDDKIDEVEEGFFRQMLPRAVSGNNGVKAVNKLTKAIENKKEAIRQSVAATKIAVKADQAEVAKQINNDQEVKRLTAAFQKSKGDAAKKRWKAQLDARKAQIESNAIVKRDPTEGEIETETRNKIQQNSEIRSLEQQLEKLGELSRDQEAMIDEFLDYIQARAEKTKNENRKALTQNLLTLLARKESALKGGRRMFVNVKKEAEKVEKTEGRRSEQAIRQEIKQRIAEDEEVKSLQRRIEQSSPKRRAELEAQIAERKKEIEAPIRKELKKNRVSEGDIQSKLEFELRKDETLKELQKELNEATPKWVEKLKVRLNDAKEGIEEDVRREAATAGGFLAANEKSAAASEDRIDSAAKAMEFAQTTGNAKLFEKAAKDFAARAAKATERFSKADKAIIEAYGKMMDEVKTLNIFGTTGRVPGILRQGFNEAKEFQGAIEKQELYDPETGEAIDIGSEKAQEIMEGKEDPLAFEPYREPRKKGDEKRQEYLEDLVARRFKELALARFDEFNEGDPNLANLVELALVKLFGGEFNGEVNGRSINKTFLPLPQKFVDPLIKFMEGGKGQTENQKIIREKYGELIDTYLLDYENDSFDLKKFEPDSPLNVPFGKRYGIASAPGANGTDVAQSNKNATAQPDRNPTREGSKAAVQSFVQGYAGLTDSDMVALDDREVDAIYQAATSKADADMAAGAVDSVVAATPGMNALLEMSGKDLMRGYLRELEAEQTRGDAETILRENLRRAATTKMFKSNTDFLDYVSKMPPGIKRATALRAKEFLKLNGQGGFNWNKIATQIAAFGKDGKQATWAGLLGTDMETGGHAIFLNLDQIHEGDIVETMLEEMDHALTHRIINAEAFGMKLNSVQQSARDRLRTDFKRAVLKAGEGMTKLAEGARGLTPEQKVAFYSNAFKDMVAESPDQFRAYYNLTNLDEFVVGIKKDGSFIDLLKELGFSEKAEGGFSISQLLKNIFTSLAELVTGRRLDANSELARAFSDAWTLSTGRSKTQWTVPPTQLSMALGVEATGGKATGSNETVRMRKEGGNAVYNAYLQQNEDGSWSVFGEFGDPTRKLQRAEKSKGKLDYEQAKAVFDKTVEAKSKKYSVIPEGPEGPQGPTGPNEGPQGPQGPTGPAPESAPGSRRNREIRNPEITREGLRARLNTARSERAQSVLRPITEDALNIVSKFYQAGFEFVRVDNLQNLDEFGRVKVLNSDFNFTLATVSEVDSPYMRPRIAWNPELATRPSFLRELETAFKGVHGVTPNEGTRRLLFTDTGDNYYTEIGRLGYSLRNSIGTLALSDGRGGFGAWAMGKDLEESVEQTRKVYEGGSTRLPDPPDLIDINSESTARTSRRRSVSALSQEEEKPRLVSGKTWDALTKFDIFQYGRPLSSETTTEIYEKAYASVGNKGRGFSPDLATSETEAIKAGRKAVLKAVIDNLKSPRYKIEASWDDDGFALTLLDKQTSKKYGRIDVSTLPENKYVEIGSTTAKSKGKEDGGGKMLYQAAYDYTIAIGGLNTSLSLTSINRIRRTSNMFASALRHGTTKHIVPNTSQKISSNWVNENTATGSKQEAYINNLSLLAQREMQNTFDALPEEIQTWRYNFETGDFIDADRKDLARERLNAAVQLGNPDESGVGMATLQRAIITNSALNEFGGQEGESKLLDVSRGPETNVAYSAPGRRSNVTRMLLGKKEGTTYTGKKVETGGWFASDALATDGVTAMFDRKTNRESFGKQQAEFYDKALGRALKKYEGQFNPNDVNPALGNIENPLTEAQAREIDELVATNQEADAAVLKNDYMEANRADFRRRQAEARKRLPEEVVKIIEEMRDTVDPLSSYADEKMGFSTAANQGIYLNRAYLIFGDEKTRELHQKQIRENPVVMENLKNYLSRQLAEQDAEALIRRATREGRILPREEALVQATANLSPTDLGAAIERVLNAGDEGVGSLFVSGRIPGQKNLKIFDARGNIAKEIQAAWGVVEDPGTNYANTVIKLANLVANDKFLQELKAVGLESGTLYDPRDPKNLNEEDGQRLADARSAALEADPTLAARSRFKPELLDRAMIAQDPVVASILEQAESKVPSKYVKLSGETNKSFAPVSGMYAEPLLFEWLTTKFPPRGEESLWMKALTQATLVPMAMKTVGSVTGQFRNYYSGYMSLLSNSNLRFWDPEWREDFKAAHRMTFGEIYRDVRGISTDATARKAMMKARERLSELGVTGQSVTMNFMQDLARLNSGKENGIVKGFDGLVQKFIQTYGASDDNFKIIHYFSELGKYRRAFPDMPQAQLEEKAAAIARGIHQTYGDTYAAVKSLKKGPGVLIAPFISFTSEVIRNTIYSGRLAWNEVKEGRATGNRELERIGFQRFIGMGVAGFGTFALTSISASLVGISGEEEREFRKLLPEWQRNNQLLFTGKENGKIRFADVTFSDPSSYLKTPVIAFFNEVWSGDERSFNEKVGKGILNAMQTLASPFVSEQLFSGSLMQLYSNKDGSGREIVNWQDDPAAIAGAVGGHLIQPFIPGTFDSLGRIGKAFTGYVSPSGRSYDKGNEIMSFFGARISEVDVRQSLGFKTKAFMQNYREAAELFTGPFLSRGTQDSESIVEGYESANSAVQRLFGELRGIYLGAVRLGVPQREVLSILKANGLSEENLAMLRSGKFKPYQASKQAITKNREAGMQTRISDYNKAYAAAQRP